ncbi:cytochrome c oxidase subunit 6C [Pempheris klunzingeri]|uniref:cytochrome c oxidase subunit 6C n=1 Tax=Pempheris klunzingeri TaxID=3127111 RepID=UPI0039805DE0
MSLPKPNMRGMLARRTTFHIAMAFTLSIGCSMVYKLLVAEPRKRAYAAFYKEYDPVKDFNAMREAGVFESVRPSGE